MQIGRVSKLLLSPLLLSVLVHLLLLLFFSVFIIMRPDRSNQVISTSNLSVPTYVYQDKVPVQVHRRRAFEKKISHKLVQKVDSTSPLIKPTDGVLKSKEISRKKSLFASSLEMISKNQFHEMSAAIEENDPIYLVGEETAFPDPFIMLLGKALSAYFQYPKMAGELGIKGIVIISLTLHPEGHFSNVIIKKSSNNHDLDAAALYAVNHAPIIEGMDRFIKKPKRFVVGYIFR